MGEGSCPEVGAMAIAPEEGSVAVAADDCPLLLLAKFAAVLWYVLP